MLFNKKNKTQKIKSNHSFNITKQKTINKNSKINKNLKQIPKAKSTEKIRLNNNKNINKKHKNKKNIHSNQKLILTKIDQKLIYKRLKKKNIPG